MMRCPLVTVNEICLESLPSVLVAVTVALKSPIKVVVPEMTHELLMLNPVANPVALQLVGLRVAGI